MTKKEIIEAINKGITVYWQSLAYEVIVRGDDLYTFCTFNRHMQYIEDSCKKEHFFTEKDWEDALKGQSTKELFTI
jgi:hypothetical protein